MAEKYPQRESGEPLTPRIGTKERAFLDELQGHTDFIILRNCDSFKSKIGRFPDGYIEELKLIIEFDERKHFVDREMTTYREKDLERIREFESLGCRVFRVSEKVWSERKVEILVQFGELVKNSN